MKSLLLQLAQVSAQHIRLAEAKHAREVEAAAAAKRDADRKAAAKAAKRKSRPPAAPNGKRASSSSSSPPAPPSTKLPNGSSSSRASQSASSYVDTRSSIARFVGAGSPARSKPVDGSAWARAMEVLERVGMLRASSVLAAIFVILVWRRRARSLDLRRRIGNGLARVRDTVSMGTKTSYL